MIRTIRLLSLLALGATASLRLFAADAPRDPRAVGAAPVLEDRYPQRSVTFPGGVTGLPDQVYAQPAGFRPLTLDVYLPPRRSGAPTAPHPLVLYIHGGGWATGHARHSGAFENWPGQLASLAARGYVVSSLNYRLSGEAPFPAAIQDVKSALRWLRAHASDLGIDKRVAIVWGGSAGGHLAALAATSCGEPALAPPGAQGGESDCVQGAILWYPITDFSALAGAAAADNPESRFLGCAPSRCPAETLRLASPLQQVTARTPPMLLVHGANDHQVPVKQSQLMHEALQKAGVQSELLVIPDVDHSFIGATADSTRRASLEALDRSIAFIARNAPASVR